MILSVVTAPASEPLTTAEAKAHSNVNISDDDTVIAGFITTAREHVESRLSQTLINTAFDLKLDHWPVDNCGWTQREIYLPRSPLSSVTSVTYYDSTNTLQTLSTDYYHVSTGSPGRIVLASGYSWPTLQDRPDAVVIRFVAGYGATSAAVPSRAKQAMNLLVDHWYKNREAVLVGTSASEVPLAVEALLASVDYGRYA